MYWHSAGGDMLLLASFTCLDACCCHGLRLPVFNKETTYLLTYLHPLETFIIIIIRCYNCLPIIVCYRCRYILRHIY